MVALVLLFIAVNYWIKARSFLDPDFGWHLRMGEIILSKGIPHGDPLSYTMPSYPFVDHEWLTNVLFSFLYSSIGLGGMSIFFAALTLIAVGIPFLFSHPKWRLLPFLLAAISFMPYLGIRPQIFSWVFFSLLLFVVFQEKLWKRFKWFLPLLILLWTNLHGSFPLGVLVIALAAFFRGFQGKSEARNPKFEANNKVQNKKYKNARAAFDAVLNLKNLNFGIVSNFDIRISDLVIVALCLVVTIINPYGARVWWEVWMQLSDPTLKWAIQEWLPALFLFNLPFFVLLCVSVPLVWKYRKQFRPINLTLYGATLLMAMSSGRHVPFWLLVALPMTIQGLEYLYEEVVDYKHGKERFAVVYKVFIIGVVAMISIDFLLMLPQARFSHLSRSPEQAVAFLKANPSKGNVFNEYGLGGYLIWQYPEKKVFIDGRMPRWRWKDAPKMESENAFVEYEAVMSGNSDIEGIMEKYHIDTIVLLTEEDPESLAIIFRKISPLHLVNKPALRSQLKRMGMEEVYRDGLVVIYRKT